MTIRKPIHKPPSRIKYEKNHPTLSCRVDKKTHILLTERLALENMSFAQFVKSQVGVFTKTSEQLQDERDTAYAEGYEEAKAEFEIVLPCSICNTPMTIKPNSNLHQAAIRALANWYHTSCKKP